MNFSPICKYLLMILYTVEREMCASRAICLTEQWLCERSSSLCTNRLDVFSIMHLRWSTTLARHSAQPNLLIFFSKWFKPPRDHLLFRNSLRNSHAVYCFFSRSTLIKCLSSTENSIVFIIINNNNVTKLLHHHKVRTAKVWWLTVSVIHVQKIVKIEITVQKLWRQSYWPFLYRDSATNLCDWYSKG